MKKHLDRVLEIVLVVLMLILLTDVIWQVFSRYVLRDPSSFTDELARYLLIWVTLLGAAYATGQKLHLAIDLLKSKYGFRWLDQFILLIIFGFSASVMVFGGWRLMSITLQLGQQSAALQIPLGYVYLILPISGILIIFYTLIQWVHLNKTEG